MKIETVTKWLLIEDNESDKKNMVISKFDEVNQQFNKINWKSFIILLKICLNIYYLWSQDHHEIWNLRFDFSKLFLWDIVLI